MRTEAAEWLHRIALICGFLSFWLAAPEILGEKRLQMVDRALQSLLRLEIKMIAAMAVLLGLFSFPIEVVVMSNLTNEWSVKTLAFVAVFDFVTSPLLVYGFYALNRYLVLRILERMAVSSSLRKRLLTAGAFLFILAFVFEFLATF